MTRTLHRLVPAVALLLATAVPRIAGAQGQAVSLLGYHTNVPAGWTSRARASSMRLAEFVTPGPDSLSRAEVVVYFFGVGQGGTVESNLVRWKAQFSTPDGSPVPETVTRDSSGAFPITFAEFRGTYARGIGAGSPETARTGQTLVAAVAETPRGDDVHSALWAVGAGCRRAGCLYGICERDEVALPRGHLDVA